MKEQDRWIPYTELDFDDKKFNMFSIDTRDFHAGYLNEPKGHKDYLTLIKYPDFFHTKKELINLIDRYYKESGGKAEWRMFSIKGFEDWSLKYLRIWRTPKGFIVCNTDQRAIRKEILALPVEQEYLYTH